MASTYTFPPPSKNSHLPLIRRPRIAKRYRAGANNAALGDNTDICVLIWDTAPDTATIVVTLHGIWTNSNFRKFHDMQSVTLPVLRFLAVRDLLLPFKVPG